VGNTSGAAAANLAYEFSATPSAVHYLQVSPHYSGGGAYTLTGQDVGFNVGNNIVLAASTGSYTITGTAAALRRGLTAAAGSYTLTGSPAAFVTTNNTILSAAAGSYTLTGSPASLVAGTDHG
jgi:hypothetical protein